VVVVVYWSLTNCLGPMDFLISKMARRFLGLEMKSLNDLYLCLRPLHAAPGDRVANSGDLARAIVFVLSGHVHLYKARTLLPDCSLLDRLFYGSLEPPAPPPAAAPPCPFLWPHASPGVARPPTRTTRRPDPRPSRARTASSRCSPARRASCQLPAPPARAPLPAQALPRPARLTLDAPCRPTRVSPETGHALPPCCAVLRGELPAAPTRHYAVHSRGPPPPAAAPRQNPIRGVLPVAINRIVLADAISL
jgi:hypothetical protein